MYPRKIPQDFFFEELFGFIETPEDVYKYITISKNKQNFDILSSANGKSFMVGHFIEKAVNKFPDFVHKDGAKFNLIIGKGSETLNYSEIDIGAVQAKKENRGATFQVASNLNCLEFLSHLDSAKLGISKYIYDNTQGPAASISATPATLYRNYFIPHTIRDNNTGIYKNYKGQLEKQINLLQDLYFIPVKNGYVYIDSKAASELNSRYFDEKEAIGYVKVGLLHHTQVTSGLKQNKLISVCNDQNQIIHQVFTAAMNMMESTNSSSLGIGSKIAKVLLNGAYRGTILSAIENSRHERNQHFEGKNKLFLTLIGGGVFGNPISWIIEAIDNQEDLIKKSGLDIYLIIHNRSIFTQPEMDGFRELVNRFKGKIYDIN